MEIRGIGMHLQASLDKQGSDFIRVAIAIDSNDWPQVSSRRIAFKQKSGGAAQFPTSPMHAAALDPLTAERSTAKAFAANS